MTGWTNERRELAVKLWKEGFSAAQIARQLPGSGISRNAVIGVLHRMGLSGAGRGKASRPRRTFASPRSPVSTAPPKTRLHPAGSRVYLVSEDRPLPLEPVEAPGAATSLTLDTGMCKWPIGDPADPDFTFCGATVQTPPYCQACRDTRRPYVAEAVVKRIDERLLMPARRRWGT